MTKGTDKNMDYNLVVIVQSGNGNRYFLIGNKEGEKSLICPSLQMEGTLQFCKEFSILDLTFKYLLKFAVFSAIPTSAILFFIFCLVILF